MTGIYPWEPFYASASRRKGNLQLVIIALQLIHLYIHPFRRYPHLIRTLFFFGFILITLGSSAQRAYRGIVADSATLENIPDVHIGIKNSGKGVVTNARGGFLIYANPSDTLIFTGLGYKTLVFPLFFEEDAILVLLQENVLMLSDVIIRSKRLYPNVIEDRTHQAPKTLDPISAIASPFDYFWKLEREKRKLSKVVEENNRTQTYRQVIADPDVRQIMMETYSISEEKFYALLVLFNQQFTSVQYFTDPDRIMEELHAFLESSLQKE